MTVKNLYEGYTALSTLSEKEKIPSSLKAKITLLKTAIEPYIKGIDEGRNIIVEEYKKEGEGDKIEIKEGCLELFHKETKELFSAQTSFSFKIFTKEELKEAEIPSSIIIHIIPFIIK